MGCHTWCYAHIPKEAEKWNKEYKEKLNDDITSFCSREDCNDAIFKIWREHAKTLLNECNNLPLNEIPSWIEKHRDTEEEYSITSPWNFGLFEVYNGKIYRETCARDENDNYIFEKQFIDPFRIHNYDAKPCFSLEETLLRCTENNVDWNETYLDSDVLMNNKSLVEDFWKTYPDGIITFG